MVSSSVAWMPSHGRHQINIGPSLGRAIKARKLKGSPAPTPKRSNLPERDFYAFRYNFKPGAIDSSKPASIEVKKTVENTQIMAEFPSKETGEVCTYNGTEIPAREVECIIIYDEETGQYTLEKLDSVVSLQFGGKRAAAPAAPSPSTEPSTSSTPLANAKGKAKQNDDDELEQLLLSGEDNTDSKRIAAIKHRLEEEEEEEGEDIDIPLRLQVAKRAPPSTTPSHPTKPTSKTKAVNTSQLPPSSSILTKSSVTKTSQMSPSTLPTPKPPKPAPKQSKKTKAAPPKTADTAPYADEEIIEIERPAKKPRISAATTTTTTSRQPQAMEPPKPKPAVELSLPGGQSTFVAPPAPPGSVIPPKKAANTHSPAIPMTVPPGVSATITMEEVLGDEAAEEEDEDEDWEAVPTSAPPVQATPSQHEYDRLEDEIFGRGFGEEEEEQEIDFNAFEAELNEQMEMEEEGEDDDDMEDVMQEAVTAASAGGTNRPISLNRLASGIAAGESDEDYSSSDSDSD